MPFKTILTVTGPGLGDGDLKLAASLCESVGAHLSALVVRMAAPPPVGEYAAMVSDAWLQERRQDEMRLAERRDSVTSYLAAGTISSDVATEYPELAWSDEAIGRRGRYADLTVVGPEVLATEVLRAKVIEGALFSSGKPLLLIPDETRVGVTVGMGVEDRDDIGLIVARAGKPAQTPGANDGGALGGGKFANNHDRLLGGSG